MKQQLLVGLVSNRRVIDGVGRDHLRIKYVTASLNVAGCVPVLIPTINDEDSPRHIADEAIRSLAQRLDAIILTGDESNIEPHRYGARHENANPDPCRDYVALGLIKACRDAKTPVLGICRGLQEINVAFGGTLVYDLGLTHAEDLSLGRDAQYRPVHNVVLSRGGLLSEWYRRDMIKVNSLHNQAIDVLGKGLEIEACTEDGLIEAASYRREGNLIVGIQWHPEWHADNEDDARKIIVNFTASVAEGKEGVQNTLSA